MGGQACVFYGAAEFSRDLDLMVMTDSESMLLMRRALAELQARPIAVPAFEPVLLDRGHAVHFRCSREDVAGLRIDLMSVLRGVDDFESVWVRREILEVDGQTVDVLSPPDLVLAKKTQRDKDWPMIRRLVEQSFFLGEENADANQIDFWLRELRTPELLIRAAARYQDAAIKLIASRPAIKAALEGDSGKVAELFDDEQREERAKDRVYWEPLKRELEGFRRKQQ